MSVMKPGQLVPNELEAAILEELAVEEPELQKKINTLHVLSREYTGVGSFTKFSPISNLSLAVGNRQIGLASRILVPNVQNGLGAVLFCENGNPTCLEICTFGNDYWDGVYSGFSIEKNA
jgi:hypothetical protein